MKSHNKSYLLACSRNNLNLELVRLGLDMPHHKHARHRVMSVISASSASTSPRPEFLVKGGAACSLQRSGKSKIAVKRRPMKGSVLQGWKYDLC